MSEQADQGTGQSASRPGQGIAQHLQDLKQAHGSAPPAIEQILQVAADAASVQSRQAQRAIDDWDKANKEWGKSLDVAGETVEKIEKTFSEFDQTLKAYEATNKSIEQRLRTLEDERLIAPKRADYPQLSDPDMYTQTVRDHIELMKKTDFANPRELFDFAEKLSAEARPEHGNVMLYSGPLRPGTWPNYPELAGGLKESRDLARAVAKEFRDGPGGVSIIDNTDRGLLMASPEFIDKCDELTFKAKQPEILRAADEITSKAASENKPVTPQEAHRKAVKKVSDDLMNESGPQGPWSKASDEFARSAKDKNIALALDEGVVERVFGKVELPRLAESEVGVTSKTTLAGNVNFGPVAKEMTQDTTRGAGTAHEANKRQTFEALKNISKQATGFMLSVVEKTQDGEYRLKPVFTKEFQDKLGLLNQNAQASVQDMLAKPAVFEGLRQASEIPGLQHLMEARNERRQGPLTQSSDSLLAALGGPQQKTPFVGHVVAMDKDTLTLKVEAAQKRDAGGYTVSLMRNEHRDLEKALMFQKVEVGVANGKYEAKLLAQFDPKAPSQPVGKLSPDRIDALAAHLPGPSTPGVSRSRTH